jgi:hypothetical protein
MEVEALRVELAEKEVFALYGVRGEHSLQQILVMCNEFIY